MCRQAESAEEREDEGGEQRLRDAGLGESRQRRRIAVDWFHRGAEGRDEGELGERWTLPGRYVLLQSDQVDRGKRVRVPSGGRE